VAVFYLVESCSADKKKKDSMDALENQIHFYKKKKTSIGDINRWH